MVPFLVDPPVEHVCRLPGRSVAPGASWFCPVCFLVWDFVGGDADGAADGDEADADASEASNEGWRCTGRFHRPVVRLLEGVDNGVV